MTVVSVQRNALHFLLRRNARSCICTFVQPETNAFLFGFYSAGANSSVDSLARRDSCVTNEDQELLRARFGVAFQARRWLC
jgi:hypothetical protein